MSNGTAHIEMHIDLLHALFDWERNDIRMIESSDIGEKNYFQVLISSPLLSEGYHGQLEIYFNDDHELRFKKWSDTDIGAGSSI